MNRRKFTKSTVPVGILAASSGCLGGILEESADSDGDGMVDSKDYAPNDPDVQTKDDLAQSAPKTKKTTKNEQSKEDATNNSEDSSTTTTTIPDVEPNTISVPSSGFSAETYITSYSSEHVTVKINDKDPSVSDVDLSQMKAAAVAYEFPRKGRVGTGVSEEAVESGKEITIPVDLSNASTNTSVNYLAYLIPKGETIDSVDSADVVHFHETNPFELENDRSTISSVEPASLKLLVDSSGENHERVSKEGVISLDFTGRTDGKDWNVYFHLFKSAYAELVTDTSNRSLTELVSYETSDGFGKEIAHILDSDAEKNGLTTERQKGEFVIDFVQSLPFSPNDLDNGFDDSTKGVAKTIAHLGGDCEDTSVLLASLLSSEPFGYDMILIELPDHMGVGIYGKDLEGSYWETDGRDYYYIESTNFGGDIGEVPAKFENDSAYLYQV